MNASAVVGVRPWLPWPLSRWSWWTVPVRAECLAALRIGLAAVLLVDVLTTYLPYAADFFGPDGLGSLEAVPVTGNWQDWRWSPLFYVTDARLVVAAVGLWLVALAGMLFGVFTRVSTLLVWVLSTSFAHRNPYIDNAGDVVRGITLFYLMLCPCGAVWSVDHWRGGRSAEEVYVWPWPLRLLFVQLVFIYFCNGMHKLPGESWQSGSSLYYVLWDLTLTRWPYPLLPIPYELTRLLAWSVLAFELTFPVLVLFRWTRWFALLFGAMMHLGIGLFLELGMFAPYMLCLYLPLLPWERLTTWRQPMPSDLAAQSEANATRPES